MRADADAMTRAVQQLARNDEAVGKLLKNQNGQTSATAGNEFLTLSEDRYRLTVPAISAVFDIDRLRREHNELVGELCVRCGLPGARTVVDGILSTADFNCSSARALRTLPASTPEDEVEVDL